jgi:hypothetical protein
MRVVAQRRPAENSKPYWNHGVAGVPRNRKSPSCQAIAREILKELTADGLRSIRHGADCEEGQSLKS